MELGGQCHAPAALTLRLRDPLPIVYEEGEHGGHSQDSYGKSVPHHYPITVTVQTVAIRYTDWAIPVHITNMQALSLYVNSC